MTQPAPSQDHFPGNIGMAHAAVVPTRVRVGRRHEQDCEPKVRLNKNGSTIESIHITCECGKEIVVKCQYTENSQ